MEIQNIPAGNNVTIELVSGESRYQVQTNVHSVKKDGIYLNPIVYNGNVLDIKRQFKGMIFNLYANDPENDKRVTWKNVQIEMLDLGGGSLVYFVTTFGFAKNSVSGERRTNSRMLVNVKGSVSVGETRFEVVVNDISADGISFYIPSDKDFTAKRIFLEFSDVVRNENFDLTVNCNVVRKVNKDNLVIVGCVITKGSKNLFPYIWMKSLVKNREEKDKQLKEQEEQKKQEELRRQEALKKIGEQKRQEELQRQEEQKRQEELRKTQQAQPVQPVPQQVQQAQPVQPVSQQAQQAQQA